MILIGHQPNYFPYIGFFEKIARSDAFALVDTVQFVKRGTFGWQHRNRIKTHDGWMWLSVPVLTKGKFHQKIYEARINNNNLNWARKHWKAIYLNYHNAPYFGKYSDFFENLYKKEWIYLRDLSETIIRYIIEQLEIKVEIIRCSDLGIEARGSELIVKLCKTLGADTYISGKHGKDYIDESLMDKNEIKIIYQDFKCPIYRQQFDGFIPNLSIIDLMFNCGEKSLDIILGNKKVIEEM